MRDYGTRGGGRRVVGPATEGRPGPAAPLLRPGKPECVGDDRLDPDGVSRRMNVLFILTDQWPAWAFGLRGAGIATPNLDRLARAGTVFTNAFTTCPLCTPARGALLTSRWPHQTGVYDNHSVGYSLQAALSLDEKTWIDAAARLGFHVGYFGKWHLGPINPEQRGAHRFDPNVELDRGPYVPATSDYSYEQCARRYEQQSARLRRGRPAFWGETPAGKEHVEPFPVMNNGVQFLEEWATGPRDEPFFLTVSSSPPHFPHYLPREYAEIADALRAEVTLPPSLGESFAAKPWFHAKPWWPCMDTSPLDAEQWRTVIAYSHAHITMVDEAIGRVLDAVDRLGLAESTAVIFTADHGDMEGAHDRFDKGPYFYDEVWRIPLIVRHPGTDAATQGAFVSLLDVGETLFRLLGAGTASAPSRAGRDLLPLVGERDVPTGWPQVAYGVYDLYNGMSFAIRASRDERFKYVWNPQDVDELYDLADDPHEMANLSGRPDHARVECGLRNRLLAWLDEIGDPFSRQVGDLPAAGTIIATGRPGP